MRGRGGDVFLNGERMEDEDENKATIAGKSNCITFVHYCMFGLMNDPSRE